VLEDMNENLFMTQVDDQDELLRLRYEAYVIYPMKLSLLTRQAVPRIIKRQSRGASKGSRRKEETVYVV
jgi:hypothetical protein